MAAATIAGPSVNTAKGASGIRAATAAARKITKAALRGSFITTDERCSLPLASR
jgi:hypothetical protein